MTKLGQRLAALVDGISKVSGWVAAMCIVAAAFIVTEGVLARKLFGASTIWQIEASIFLLIFAVFVGAAFVQKNEHHLNVDLVILLLPSKVRAVNLILVSIASCLLAGFLAWKAWPMWWDALREGERSESLWSPPMAIPYFFLPFGMTLLFLEYLVYIARKAGALWRGEVEGGAERAELREIDLPPASPDEGDASHG